MRYNAINNIKNRPSKNWAVFVCYGVKRVSGALQNAAKAAETNCKLLQIGSHFVLERDNGKRQHNDRVARDN